jgi:NitT/TauT family transport system substrate-binding protein
MLPRRSRTVRRCRAIALALLVAACASTGVQAATTGATPLKIGYSDWPGWVAWQIAIDKNWFAQAGVDIQFQWFDYSASMDACAAGKIDADLMTNGDTLVTGAGGARSVMVLLTDYSSGNDMIVARPGVHSLQDLKGKKVAVEIGLVEHLLLLNGLQKAGMSERDVTLVNAKTNELPQILATGDVAAIGAWQPVSGQSMKLVAGARPVYTSADEPGLIYDALAINPASLAARRNDWKKVAQIWDRVVAYIADPKTAPDSMNILSARVGISPAAFQNLLAGTHLLSLAEGRSRFVKSDGFGSLYGSSRIADRFNVANGVYKAPQNVDPYIDSSLLTSK